jgi:hypothetical protein
MYRKKTLTKKQKKAFKAVKKLRVLRAERLWTHRADQTYR